MCNSKAEAEETLTEFEQKLSGAGLQLNKSKCNIISDQKGINVGDEIAGVKVVKSFKYLGFKVTCDRKALIKDARQSCKKYLQSIKGRIRSSDEQLNKLIYAAFYRSLLVYYMTPIYAAGLIKKHEIDNLEAELLRKQNLMPNDVRSTVINNLLGHFTTPTSSVIAIKGSQLRQFSKEDARNPTRKCKGNV
jgi:hypothetical protein